jgi:hypothetical protein
VSYDSYLSSFTPTGWWKLADSIGSASAVDSSGNGLTLTASGTVTFGQTTPSPINSETGALFDGTTGLLTGTVSAGIISAVQGSFTVIAWANATSWTAYNGQIVNFGYSGSNGTDSEFQINLGPSYAAGLSVGFFGDDWHPNPTITAGWHMIAVTVVRGSSTSVRSMYIDNTYVGNNTSAGNLTIASGSQVNIGDSGLANYWSGDIAQVALIPSVLTSTQIYSLYSGGPSFVNNIRRSNVAVMRASNW